MADAYNINIETKTQLDEIHKLLEELRAISYPRFVPFCCFSRRIFNSSRLERIRRKSFNLRLNFNRNVVLKISCLITSIFSFVSIFNFIVKINKNRTKNGER